MCLALGMDHTPTLTLPLRTMCIFRRADHFSCVRPVQVVPRKDQADVGRENGYELVSANPSMPGVRVPEQPAPDAHVADMAVGATV